LRSANEIALLCWRDDSHVEADEMERREGVIVVGAGPVGFLTALGLVADAVAIGLKSWAFTFRVPATGTIVSVDNRLTAPDDHENTYNLHFGQHILERLPNTEIRWQTRVVGLKQDAKSVTVMAETPRGPLELQADWVIGTDGARSGVRHALGLPSRVTPGPIASSRRISITTSRSTASGPPTWPVLRRAWSS
jgi:hypothetical protein